MCQRKAIREANVGVVQDAGISVENQVFCCSAAKPTLKRLMLLEFALRNTVVSLLWGWSGIYSPNHEKIDISY